MSMMADSIVKMLPDQRVWDRIDKHSMPEPNSGCVLWIGHVDKDGYAKMTGPRFKYKRVAVSVSRVVLSRKLDRLAEGLALHTCDVSCCIAESHLYEGSHRQNVADAVARNRINASRDNYGRFACNEV